MLRGVTTHSKQTFKFILIRLLVLLITYLFVYISGEILFSNDMFGNDDPALNKMGYYFLMSAPLLGITGYLIIAIIAEIVLRKG